MRYIPDDSFIGEDENIPKDREKEQIIVSPLAADSGVPVWLYWVAGAAVLWFLLTRKNR